MIKKISDPPPNVHIENRQIKQVCESKTLGVTIASIYLGKVILKIFAKKIVPASVLSVVSYVNKATLISVCNAFTRPCFVYCCEVWDVFAKFNQNHFKTYRIELLGLYS